MSDNFYLIFFNRGKLMIEQENGHIILVKVPSFQLKFDQNNNKN
jgi:hypothetical protein